MALCVPAAFRMGFWEFSTVPCSPGLGWELFHSLLLSVASWGKSTNALSLVLHPSHSSCSEFTGRRKLYHFSCSLFLFPSRSRPQDAAVPVHGESTAREGDPALPVLIFWAILQRPRAWGTRWELLTPNSPCSLEPLLGSVSSVENFETFLKGISYK